MARKSSSSTTHNSRSWTSFSGLGTGVAGVVGVVASSLAAAVVAAAGVADADFLQVATFPPSGYPDLGGLPCGDLPPGSEFFRSRDPIFLLPPVSG